MFKKIRKGLKGVKRFMEEKIQACKDVFSDTRMKLMIGLMIMGAGLGIGGAIVASVYVPIPA